MRQVIAISGCSGGDQGPQGVYSELQSRYQNDSLSISPLDTSPDEIDGNVEKVKELAREVEGVKEVYLIGYSMGGVIAAQAAHELKGKVKGLVLLNSQIEGLQYLNDLDIPVLFYQGKKDEIFPGWQMKSTFQGYKGPKKWIALEGLDHGFKNPQIQGRYTRTLASELHSEMSSFFFEKSHQKEDGTEVNKSISVDNQGLIRKLLSFIPW